MIEPTWTGNDHVFGLWREHAAHRLLVLANFMPERQPVALEVVRAPGLTLDPSPGPDGRPLTEHGESLVLEPYQLRLAGQLPRLAVARRASYAPQGTGKNS